MAKDTLNLITRTADRIAKLFAAMFGDGPVAPVLDDLRRDADELDEAVREYNTPFVPFPPPGPQPGRTRVYNPPDRTDPREPPGEYPQYAQRLSSLVQTRPSTNVYSFQYDYIDHILYVTYKTPIINPGVQNIGGRVVGQLGHTVMRGPRPHQPGFLYAYYDVPVEVFSTLIRSSSPGGAVWDLLRVRGTIHGTQYRYRLMSGSVGPGERGELAVYIPRRATRRGFRTRAVPTMGTGRRGFMQSSLPEEV